MTVTCTRIASNDAWLIHDLDVSVGNKMTRNIANIGRLFIAAASSVAAVVTTGENGRTDGRTDGRTAPHHSAPAAK